MLKTRILLVVGSLIVIWLIFLLPKVVVDNDEKLTQTGDSTSAPAANHAEVPSQIRSSIRALRVQFQGSTAKEKNAIFADSLANLYQIAGKFDSAAWFAEEASKFFNTAESWIKAGDQYYQAYSFALDQTKQNAYAEKTREFYQKALDSNPHNLDIKTKMAMTYLSSGSPMQGITMLREVLAENPKYEPALFNMGMLSIQSRQYDRAVERLTELIKINPNHTQAHLLLGIAWMNTGEKDKAREQFIKVKQMDKDPAVQATADSYLKDLK
ncbi:MAG TPA: tetratricopeptide repeat protein [Chryseolinea sp.]|nr:tetratricopeptide repeat protein [Chryseolinea sp.]